MRIKGQDERKEEGKDDEGKEKRAAKRSDGSRRNLLGLSTDLIGFLVADWARGKQQRALILLRDKFNKSYGARHPLLTPPHPRLSNGDKLSRGPSTTGSSYSVFLSDRAAKDTQETQTSARVYRVEEGTGDEVW